MAPPFLTYPLRNGLVPRVVSEYSNGTDTDKSLTPTPTFPVNPSNSTVSTSTTFVLVIESTTSSSPRTLTKLIQATPTPTRFSSALTKTTSLSNGAIIGIAVGGFTFLILVLIVIILLWKYKRRREAQEARYTPWSRINSGGSSDHTGAVTGRPSNAISENTVIEISIPTPFLFDSPVSLQQRSHPFRTSTTVDGRALLKSLVPNDHPIPQLSAQPHSSSTYPGNVGRSPRSQRPPTTNNMGMPAIHVTGSSNSSPSVYESDPDLDEISHKAVNPHTVFTNPKPRPLTIPVSSWPAGGPWQAPRDSNTHETDFADKYPQAPVLKPPPAVLTRSRSRETRAIAELIKAIDAPSSSPQKRISVPSSRHNSIRSETDDSVGIAVTTPFTYSSLYGVSSASAQSSMTNTILHQLTADFPLPPDSTSSAYFGTTH